VWPVRPEQTSSYVGFGVSPPAYTAAVVYTPGAFQKRRSAPQKQPMPTTIRSNPSGNGGVIGVSRTRWRDVTGIAASRPGSAVSADGSSRDLRRRKLIPRR
jgi:hypothetical protein